MLPRSAESGNITAIIYLLARVSPEWHRSGFDPRPAAPKGRDAARDNVVTF
jgi:hypothetical protein